MEGPPLQRLDKRFQRRRGGKGHDRAAGANGLLVGWWKGSHNSRWTKGSKASEVERVTVEVAGANGLLVGWWKGASTPVDERFQSERRGKGHSRSRGG